MQPAQPPSKKADDQRDYVISPPLTYPVPPSPVLAAPGEPAAEKRAVWIVHGMGQQLPFETLDSLAEGLRPFLRQGHPPRFRAVNINNQTLRRVELDLRGRSGTPYELHLYEAYWAPITEGAATLRDVMGFLFDGAFRGLLNARKKFQRAMFGRMLCFRIPARAALEIFAVLLTLLALIVINAVILAAAAARNQLPVFSSLPLTGHWPVLTALATCMSAVALTFGAVLFLAEMSKPGGNSTLKKILLLLFGWTGLVITVASIVACAGLMGAVLRWQAVAQLLADMPIKPLQSLATLLILSSLLIAALAMACRAWIRSQGQRLQGNFLLLGLFLLAFLLHLGSIAGPVLVSLHPDGLPAWFAATIDLLGNPAWVWPFLIALSAQIRSLMIEYAGDVAIYVSSSKLDRFDKIRKEIKELARSSASAVFAARRDNGAFEYDRVAIVGHSLGSVIAYDTLNRLLTDDALAGGQLRVSARTCLFETFGSPLDKTAFFFTVQGTSSFCVREQMAALTQPMIQDYARYRPFPWVNIYSPSDIISGKLNFYDDHQQQSAPPRVENVRDKDAVVPLIAHVDYWRNSTVWDTLCAHIAP